MENKAAPIKRSKEAIKKEYIQKAQKMIRGRIMFYHMRGIKEKDLVWRDLTKPHQIHTKKVRHMDIIEIPFHYAVDLNKSGLLKRNKHVPMRLEDSDGNPRHVQVNDDEQIYYFRPMDLLSNEELAELEPNTIKSAQFLD